MESNNNKQSRLLIYIEICLSGDKGHKIIIDSLSGYFDKIVEVKNDYENSLKPINEISDIIDANEYDIIYMINDKISPPLHSIEKIFPKIEMDNKIHCLWNMEDLFGEEKPNDVFYGEDLNGSIPLFIGIPYGKSELALMHECLNNSSCLQMFCREMMNIHSGESCFGSWIKENYFSYDDVVPFCFNSHEYVKSGFPFALLSVFKIKRQQLIKYGTDNDLFDLYTYTKENKAVNEVISEYFRKECDAAFLKVALNLNFIFSENDYNSQYSFVNDIAVFAHLYYNRDFPYYVGYLINASQYCDVYISVDSNEKKDYLISLLDESVRPKFRIIVGKNRGRDLSALLVTLRPYISQYEYFCFLHDKQSHKGEVPTIGRSFSSEIWDNLLGFDKAVPRVRRFFDKNPDIGFLSPPPPYWGNYHKMRDNLWTICYDKTLEVAKKLNLNVSVSDEINPVALGTSFWCRSHAVLPLLSYNWEYEDFDREPLAIDGTLNHALERIFPYVALQQGYLTGWSLTDRFAKLFLESNISLLDDMQKNPVSVDIVEAIKKSATGVKGATQILLNACLLFFKSTLNFFKKSADKIFNSKNK